MLLLDGFEKYIEENELFTHNDKILLTVSGGVDSMVMMALTAAAGYRFGVAHCKVVGVFKPHRWYYTEPGSRKTRIQFEGEEIMDSPYLGMDLSDYFKGVQNPVRYIGNW